MTAADEPSGEAEERPPEHAAGRPAGTKHRADFAHLDEDVEALEDPVHTGDAQHQHELHTHPPGKTG